jgi:holo-[acyl-carrier protein] synthase
MIIGIGIDIIEIDRIDEMYRKWGDFFLEKVYTPNEIAYCKSKAFASQNFAARFACKEAFYKAASHIPGYHFGWRNIEVLNSESGKPDIRIMEPYKKLFIDLTVHVSLSHSDKNSTAVIIIEK